MAAALVFGCVVTLVDLAFLVLLDLLEDNLLEEAFGVELAVLESSIVVDLREDLLVDFVAERLLVDDSVVEGSIVECSVVEAIVECSVVEDSVVKGLETILSSPIEILCFSGAATLD